MSITATFHLQIDLATGETYSFNSSGEAFNAAGTNSQNSFKPKSFEITRNIASKTVTFEIPRLEDSNNTLSLAMASDVLQTEARVRYSIIINNVIRVLLYGRVSKVVLTDATIQMTISSFFENLKYGKVVKLSSICRNRFTDSLCGFDRSSVTFPFTIDTVSNDRLSFTTVETLTEQQFQDGTLNLVFPQGRALLQDIAANDANRVFLWERLPDFFQAGSVLPFTQGCLKTESACRAYSNFINFGGVPSNSPNWNPSQLQAIAGAGS